MDDAWKKSLGHFFGETFDGFEKALRDCPDKLWEESLWHSTDPWPAAAILGADRPETERGQVVSAFWYIAWHALDTTHYDLEGQHLPKWAPPSPFSELDFDNYLPVRVFSRSELQGYLSDTRRKADATVSGLTDEDIARPVEVGHRYAGIPYAALLIMCLTHSQEHLAQLNMFLGQRGIDRS